MSRQLSELEALLRQLIAEHRKLVRFVDDHQAAMRAMDLKAMDAAASQQEACRLRIATAENKRRMLAVVLAKQAGIQGEPTLSRLAEAYPQRQKELIDLRDELKSVIMAVANKTHVAGKLAGAVLGHLNTVVRVIAGAVEQAGVYTRQGIPKVTARIGVVDAVG